MDSTVVNEARCVQCRYAFGLMSVPVPFTMLLLMFPVNGCPTYIFGSTEAFDSTKTPCSMQKSRSSSSRVLLNNVDWLFPPFLEEVVQVLERKNSFYSIFGGKMNTI